MNGRMNGNSMKATSARAPSRWQRYKYWLSALLLMPPVWYTYQALNPSFPPSWEQQTVGPFTVTPMPLNDAAPYPHDGGHLKDFAVTFCAGCWRQIHSAHLVVGAAPAELSPDLGGLLHGGDHLQHVHAPFPRKPASDERLWLTVEDWQGHRYHVAWTLNGTAVPAAEVQQRLAEAEISPFPQVAAH